MYASYLPDGSLAVSGVARAERFRRIWAGIGWPDREPGYFGVIGERTDGRYHALWERSGGLWELGDAAKEAKDRFFADCLWVDARDVLATSYLRTLEGLCFAGDAERNGRGDCITQRCPRPNDSARWATILPVPDRITENYRSALEKTRGVILRGDLFIHETQCPKLLYTIRQPLEDLLRSPVMRAVVWVIAALVEAGAGNGVSVIEPDAWYGNPPR
jgi:hypothetical protein